MRKKKSIKNLSNNTSIQPPAMELERQHLCSVQNSCTGSCPCPALKAALAKRARLEAEQTELLRMLEAESAELQRMLFGRQWNDRR